MKEIYKEYLSHYCFDCDSKEIFEKVCAVLDCGPYYGYGWKCAPRNRDKSDYIASLVYNKVKTVEDAIFVTEEIVDWKNEGEIYLDYLEGDFTDEEQELMDKNDFTPYYDTDVKKLDFVETLMNGVPSGYIFPRVDTKDVIRICQGDDWRDVARDMEKESGMIFTVYPIGTTDFPLVVKTNVKTYRRYMRAKANNDFRYFTFRVIDIPGETMKALCHNADDRGTSRNGWYAHSRKHDYNYRRENSREGVRVIDINTYK